MANHGKPIANASCKLLFLPFYVGPPTSGRRTDGTDLLFTFLWGLRLILGLMQYALEVFHFTLGRHLFGLWLSGHKAAAYPERRFNRREFIVQKPVADVANRGRAIDQYGPQIT